MKIFNRGTPICCMLCIQQNNLIRGVAAVVKEQATPYIEWRNKGFSYFCNTQCEYFPCHNTDEMDFNCLFCYCPLYDYPDCGGTFVYLKNGTKDCSACTFPHRKENYGLMMERLQKKGEYNR